MSQIVEAGDNVSPALAHTLKIIAGAMGGGLTLMAGLVAWSYVNAAGKVPTPDNVRLINLLTTVAMLIAVTCIFASEFVWRRVLKNSSGSLGARVQTAFIVRLALREGGALIGMTVAYLAAVNGVVRVYPAYWVNMVPYGLFLGFLAAHWPSSEKLTAEARDALYVFEKIVPH